MIYSTDSDRTLADRVATAAGMVREVADELQRRGHQGAYIALTNALRSLSAGAGAIPPDEDRRRWNENSPSDPRAEGCRAGQRSAGRHRANDDAFGADGVVDHPAAGGERVAHPLPARWNGPRGVAGEGDAVWKFFQSQKEVRDRTAHRIGRAAQHAPVALRQDDYCQGSGP